MSIQERRSATVVVVHTNVPDYRARFFTSLSERLGSRLVLMSGNDDFAPDIQHVDALVDRRLKNHYLLGGRLLWQSGSLRPAVRADIAVLLLNPRIVTVWIVLVMRRLLGRRSILWGHAWPRKGRTSPTNRLRRVLRSLADTLIVYTHSEARDLHELSPGVDVVAVPNALYTEEELGSASHQGVPRDFLCVGRLTPAKKPELLLQAFLLAKRALPADVRVVFVGDGGLRTRLESTVADAGLRERVRFLGHVSDLDELRSLYANAIASVSPGSAGLSLIQSLGFGVPMLIARREPHGPEIEAALEGDNAIFFPSDSPRELASTLIDVAREREHWLARRTFIATHVRTHYTIDGMVDSFLSALRLDDLELEPSDRSLP